MEAQQNPQPQAAPAEVSASASSSIATDATPASVTNYSTLSACELIDHLALLMQSDVLPEKKQIEIIRSTFYRKKEQIDATNADEVAQIETQEVRMNDLLQTFKEQDRKRAEEQERVLEENKVKSEELLKRLEDLLSGGEDFGKIYTEYHQIREAWEAARPLSPQVESAMRKSFAVLRDRFYDLKAINEELREYDFRKNLEAKTALLAEIEPLAACEDPVAAVRALTPLVDRWHNLGPVSREVRAEIHGKFKELTTSIFKKHQDYHDQRRQKEAENLEAKTKLCEQVEAILSGTLPGKKKEWEELVLHIQELQAQWKTIGFCNRKDGDAIYARFRAGLDTIFAHRTKFFSTLRVAQTENAKKRKDLIRQAQELQDSEDWDKTAVALQNLQKEWIAIGGAPTKNHDVLWAEFKVCFDNFFGRLKEHRKAENGDMKSNLVAKRAILEELEALRSDEQDNNVLKTKLGEIGERWRAIGHVARKQANSVNGRFKELMDDLYARVRSQRFQRRIDGYEATLSEKSADSLGEERQRMTRLLDRMRSELQTYENNISFLNVSSKGGSSLLRDIERKREKLATDIALLEEKVKRLNQKGKE